MAKVKLLLVDNDILVPFILKEYLFDEAIDQFEKTDIETYCMARSMKLLQSGLEFRDCGGAASIFALALQLIRAGLVTYVCLKPKSK